MLADGWATALNILGPDAGLELATKQDIPALFLVRSPDGTLRERESPAFTLAPQRRSGHSGPAMTTILLTIGVLGAVMFGMAIGAIFAGKTLRGSCGGIGNKSCDCGPEKKADCADGRG